MNQQKQAIRIGYRTRTESMMAQWISEAHSFGAEAGRADCEQGRTSAPDESFDVYLPSLVPWKTGVSEDDVRALCEAFVSAIARPGRAVTIPSGRSALWRRYSSADA